jgi:hypothetical protein
MTSTLKAGEASSMLRTLLRLIERVYAGESSAYIALRDNPRWAEVAESIDNQQVMGLMKKHSRGLEAAFCYGKALDDLRQAQATYQGENATTDERTAALRQMVAAYTSIPEKNPQDRQRLAGTTGYEHDAAQAKLRTLEAA